MRALVAGGAGFLGSHLCDRLLADGHQVICLDNLATGRARNVAHLAGRDGFQFVEHDLIERLPSLPSVERIYHLASPASPPGYQQRQVDTMRVNSEGTRRLLELADAGDARLLYASTSEIYGDPLEHPQSESYRGNVSTTGPRSMYDEGKRFGEALCMAFLRERGVDVRIVRIFNTYGPRSDPADGRMVPNFVVAALRGDPLTVYDAGAQTRSLCFVDDTVDGIVRMMEAPEMRGEVVNLGNPEEHTVIEFAELIVELVASDSEITYGPQAVGDDPLRRCPDITRARERLGWEPQTGLRDGLAHTIEYFRAELSGAHAAS